MAYQIILLPPLIYLYDVFHVSQLRRYISGPSHVIQVDVVQMEYNLTVDVSPVQIEDQEVKQMHGKEIALVKVVWGGPDGGSMT